MSRFAMIGDSHAGVFVNAIRTAGRRDLVRGGPVGAATRYFAPFFEATGAGVRFLEEHTETNYTRWKERTQSAGIEDFPGRLIVSMGLAGAQFYGADMWRRFSTQADGKKRFASAQLVDAVVASMQRHVFDFYEHCIAHGLLAAAIAAPPPQRRSRSVKALGEETVLALNDRYTASSLAFLRERGVIVIEPDWSDGRGFLRKEFWGEDAHHAGMACGPIAVQAIEAALG